jgi:hypothetical protein
VQRLLHGMHDPRPGATPAAKWLTKSSSGSQAKPCLSTARCASAGPGTQHQQSADRFALIQAEGRDVDQAGDVRRIRAQAVTISPP